MAGLASALVALITVLSVGDARAGDVFTGVQLDAEAQYFSYLGVKENLPWQASGYRPFLQLFATAQTYEYESGRDDIDADVQSLTPSLGVSRSSSGGDWTFSALIGPEIEWKRERGFPNDRGRETEVGVMVQGEAHHWRDGRSVHAILSYASLDDFFFGRLRSQARVFDEERNAFSLSAGFDVAGMGNDDYRAVQLGPVLQLPIAQLFLSAKGGYQYDSSVGSGAYGGIEFYAPF